MKTKTIFVLLFLIAVPLGGDTLDSLLALAGHSKSDLGYRPKGYWLRYPNPKLIPYKLPAFDDLFAEPLMVYEYARTMGNVANDYLSDSLFDSTDFALHRLVYFLGVDRKITGFRNYSTNLSPRVSEANPLQDALRRVREMTGAGMNDISFGGSYGSDSIIGLEKVPREYHRAIAKLILNILDAYSWWRVAVRHIDDGAAAKLASSGAPSRYGQDSEFYPEFDDVASTIDEHSLYYSAMKLADAAQKAAVEIDSILKSHRHRPPDFIFRYDTPIGEVVVTGGGNDVVEFRMPLLLYLDLGGDDEVHGPVGVGLYPTVPVSVAIDMGGDDTYYADSAVSQGVGIIGNGVLVDWHGDDRYFGADGAQGFGMFGLGLLFDNDGNDEYQAELAAQGAGTNGIGILADRHGDDKFYIYGQGQGAGLAGGIGVLVNRYGDDSYTAEPYSSVFDLGDYHSKHRINANGAQGYGGGRRGDGSDGHSYAGGLGALIDVEGDDRYYSGNWTLGIGYWYGIGIVWDGAGDDLYRSCYFTQGSGAHYAIGALFDEDGDDRHELFETAGAALGFGWDFVDAIFFDRNGNDFYDAKIISIGVAEIRSNAFFIDLQGDDEYRVDSSTLKFGAADYRKSYKVPNRYSPFGHMSHSLEFGIFIDGGGNDRYLLRGKDGKLLESNTFRDNNIWFQPDPESEKHGYGNIGVGIDTENGRIDEFRPF